MKRKSSEGTETTNIENTEQKSDKSNNDKKQKRAKFEKPVGKKLKNVNKEEDKKVVNNSENTEEKPNWIELKKQSKELKEKRRVKKLSSDVYDITIKAKKIGEKLRKRKLDPIAREKLSKQLHDLVQKQYVKLIFAHDTSRVIQWQIKYSNDDIRNEIINEVKNELQHMFFSKYAKNIIRTFIKVGSDSIKQIIVESCFGNVVKLLSSAVSAQVFEKIYVEVATKHQKTLLKQEFYGNLYKSTKDPKIETLSDVFKFSEDLKAGTLSVVHSHLTKILNKNLINSSLIHTVLSEYLTNCSKESRSEMIVMLRELIAELTQTRDGATAGVICIWHGTNKDRKVILKALKEHMKDILLSEHGFLLIFALFDCVDDTVLIKKIILTEIVKNLKEMVKNENAKRIILYLVARRNKKFFHPKFINFLKQSDDNETSKKPANTREKELLDSIIEDLLQNLLEDIAFWLSTGPLQLITLAIIKASPSNENLKAIFEAISKHITSNNLVITKDETNNETKVETKDEIKDNKKGINVIEDPGLHMVLKDIIKMDKEKVEKNESTFGEILTSYLNSEIINLWISLNRGCFLLVVLLENESEVVASKIKELLNVKELKAQNSKGAEILLQRLSQ